MPSPTKKQVKPKSASKPKSVSKPKNKSNSKTRAKYLVFGIGLLAAGIIVHNLYSDYLWDKKIHELDIKEKESMKKLDDLLKKMRQEYEKFQTEWQRDYPNNDDYYDTRRIQNPIDMFGLPQDVQDDLQELYSKTDIVEIERYCRQIQRKYHPQTALTGDAEKSKIINAECDRKKGKN